MCWRRAGVEPAAEATLAMFPVAPGTDWCALPRIPHLAWDLVFRETHLPCRPELVAVAEPACDEPTVHTGPTEVCNLVESQELQRHGNATLATYRCLGQTADRPGIPERT